MPIVETRNDDQRRLRWTALPPLTLTDAFKSIETALTEGIWHYAMLIDLRLAILSVEESNLLFGYVAEIALQAGPHGPMALIARDATAVATAVRYALSSSAVSLPVQVFWDIESAERWINLTANGRP